MKKKKERTPEQEKRRFFVAVGILGFMIVSVLIHNTKDNIQNGRKEKILGVLNEQLDKAIEEKVGPGTEIISCLDYERINEGDRLRKEMADLAEVRDLLTDKNVYGNYVSQIDSIKRILDSDAAKKEYFIRRILLRRPDGKELIGFQKTPVTLEASELVYMIERMPNDTIRKYLNDNFINELKTE